MTTPGTQSAIPSTRIAAGASTTPLPTSTAVFNIAEVVIDRTVNRGLNSLPAGSSLTLGIDYSLDGGATWVEVASQTWAGGTITFTKNGVTSTETQDSLAISRGQPFPVGTQFQMRTDATNQVTIGGGSSTVTYS